MERLRKKGKDIQRVQIQGRKIATSFWGAGWCDHMESFSDFENRLPRGRTYVRNGSVCHLEIKEGEVEALVSGSELYTIKIQIKALPPREWERVRKACAGQIGSVLELLKGNLSKEVMAIVTDRERGLFPKQGEMSFKCSCPDWADMCKHVAAALYGIGHRLDQFPELLFKLRGVDAQDLAGGAMEIGIPDAADAADALAESDLGGIFGVEIEAQAPAVAPARSEPAKAKPAKAAKPLKAVKPGSKPSKAGSASKTKGRPSAAAPKKSAELVPVKREAPRPAAKAKRAATKPAAKSPPRSGRRGKR